MKKTFFTTVILASLLGLTACTHTTSTANKKMTCQDHQRITTLAYSYILDRFDKAYFSHNDFDGATAQLYLVEKKAPTDYAKNINAAQKSYEEHYTLAKQKKCDVSSYKPSPIASVKKQLKSLVKK